MAISGHYEYDSKAIAVVAKNIEKILLKYGNKLHMELKGEVAILMPGAGEFPGLIAVCKELRKHNPELKSCKVDLVDPNPPFRKERLIQNIQDEIPELPLKIEYHAFTTQIYNRTFPDRKYDVIIFENPIIDLAHSVFSAVSNLTAPFSNSPRVAFLSALKHIKEDGLIIVLNFFQHEPRAAIDLLKFSGVDCTSINLPSYHRSSNLFPVPLLTNSCSNGFVVKARNIVPEDEANNKIDKLISQDRWSVASFLLCYLTIDFLPKGLPRKIGLITAAGGSFFSAPNERNLNIKKVICLFLACAFIISFLNHLSENPAQGNPVFRI